MNSENCLQKTVLSIIYVSALSSLLQEVGSGDLTNAVLIMLYHVKEANAIFMTKVGERLGKNPALTLLPSRTLTTTTRATVLGLRCQQLR